jgi:hypothetical protein
MFKKFSFLFSFVLVLCLFGNALGLEWADKDIGNPGLAGSSSYDPVTDTVSSFAGRWRLGCESRKHGLY